MYMYWTEGKGIVHACVHVHVAASLLIVARRPGMHEDIVENEN